MKKNQPPKIEFSHEMSLSHADIRTQSPPNLIVNALLNFGRTNFGGMFFIAGAFAAIMLMTGCQEDKPLPLPEEPAPPITETDGTPIINNDSDSLSSRITTHDELVPIEPIGQFMPKSGSPVPVVDHTQNFAFKLKAEVNAPVLNGRTLMATHVAIKDNFAFVSYNVRGADFGGAVEVFDVTDVNSPRIIAQAKYPLADINSVDYADGKLFIVGAMGDFEKHGYSSPAFFEVLNLNAQMGILASETPTRVNIASFSANGIKVTADRIFITSGDKGGLTVLNRSYHQELFVEIADARSVDVNNANVYVLSGQPGTISVFDRSSLARRHTWEVGGANTPYSKSEISVNEKYIFAALNEGGARMLTPNGQTKQRFLRPLVPAGELAENHVTNSAEINNTLLFMGNGHSGIAVGEIIPKLNDSVVILGRMAFTDMQSSNFVQSEDSVVFVASGLGGLKILSITINHGVPPGIITTDPCPTLMDAIRLMFPENVDARVRHPNLFLPGSSNVITAEETDVYITFIHEGAGWKNTFGFYTYPANNPPDTRDEWRQLRRNVIFPNVSLVGEGGGLESGDKIKLGRFPANTVIGFYLVGEGWRNGQMVQGRYTQFTDFNLHDCPQRRYRQRQQHLLFIENGCQDLVLTFEDICVLGTNPRSNFDFNDIIFSIRDNPNDLPNTRFKTESIIVLGR